MIVQHKVLNNVLFQEEITQHSVLRVQCGEVWEEGRHPSIPPPTCRGPHLQFMVTWPCRRALIIHT